MTIEWIAKKLGTDIPDPQRINPDDFVELYTFLRCDYEVDISGSDWNVSTAICLFDL